MDIVHVQMMKAVCWERAKGELRAMVSACGHRRLCGVISDRTEDTEQAVEDFINNIENEGLCE